MALAYVVIAVKATLKGLNKLQADPARIAADIDDAWEVMAEPIQTVMRRYAVPEAYEKLKALTRGQAITREALHEFIRALDIPAAEKDRLTAMTPAAYVGLASDLARDSD